MNKITVGSIVTALDGSVIGEVVVCFTNRAIVYMGTDRFLCFDLDELFYIGEI